ncbi:VCBS repeat-containing protein [Streptomyces sp. NPDC048057]|uniref:FG-GAP repeat domain-containing protein n=1 Tax=Streptomyces sp. NPDC048057 TaxID=3155628 RepID=UPI0033E83F84
MRTKRTITAALIPTLTLGGLYVGTNAAVAAPSATTVATAVAATAVGPWSTPAPFTAADGNARVLDVTTASDGSAVAVWHRNTGTPDSWELWAATRPAKSTEWAPARRVATGSPVGGELLASDDGSVTLSWLQKTGSDWSLTMSTLSGTASGPGTWTPATQIARAGWATNMTLAGSPSGKLVALWTDEVVSHPNGATDSKLYVSERQGSGGAWSTPLVLAEDRASAPAALVEPDGTVTLAWDVYGSPDAGENGVHVLTRAAGATGWGTPTVVGGSVKENPSLRSVLSRGANGAAVLGWSSNVLDGNNVSKDRHQFAYRPAGSAAWGAAEDVPQNTERVSDPLIGAAGEVTYVWSAIAWGAGDPKTGSTRTATRAADGTWGPTVTLSTNQTSNGWHASVGADGTVHAYWSEWTDVANVSDVFTAARVGGAWSKPTEIGQSGTYESGIGSTGRGGESTLVWDRRNSSTAWQLWSAGTGLTTPSKPAAEHRDHVGDDGFPDLFARSSTGAVTIYKGNAAQTVSAKVSAGTWPTGSTLVPFGDLNGDGANDVLVRDASGALHRYGAPRGTVVTPQSPATRIGTGWSGFDALTYSGDLTGDGIPDLVARHAATGDLRLYSGTRTGGITAAGRIGTNWKSLTIVGAGDLNGDQRADLLARTPTGDLYRYFGTGQGTLQGGVKIGTGWGGFKDIVGLGDLTGDGKDDVVGRTAAGDLMRYAGNGTGGVTRGVKIGTGWKSFTSIH